MLPGDRHASHPDSPETLLGHTNEKIVRSAQLSAQANIVDGTRKYRTNRFPDVGGTGFQRSLQLANFLRVLRPPPAVSADPGFLRIVCIASQ